MGMREAWRELKGILGSWWRGEGDLVGLLMAWWEVVNGQVAV